MKSFIKVFAVSMFLFIMLNSCSKDSSSPTDDNNNNNNNNTPEYYFTCDIEGNINGKLVSRTSELVFGYTENNTKVYSIYGTNLDQTFTNMLQVNIILSHYAVGETSSINGIVFVLDHAATISQGEKYATDKGFLNISKNDGKTLEGTFSFEAKNHDGELVKIKNGKFKLKNNM